MKISLEWLSQYIALPASAQQLADQLTMAGLEIEGIASAAEGLAGVVVGQIKSSEKHPNADKLSVTQIDAGGPALLQVVCGAKNYQVGDKVPLAKVGAKLPNGMEIKQSQLRGMDSSGMLCSARELGLSEDASGLLILDPAATVGAPIAEALGLNDTVFEVNVTPNRPDALSHLGIAREVAVMNQSALKLPEVDLKEAAEPAASKVKVRIEDPTGCPRYAARVIDGITIGPSPEWLTRRLKACGVRSINNVVDVTNYVLLESGQPLHAFDLDKVQGAEIVVRRARGGEKLTTLDGKERVLAASDLVIADRDSAQVLAGVMGGAQSEVSPTTRTVLLECANFQPASVRKSAKSHGLHSESSHRFERGTDVHAVPRVLDRAAALIAELSGGRVLQGRIDVYPTTVEPRRVTLEYARVTALLGTPVEAAESKRILEALGFVTEASTATGATFRVPGARVDVERAEDLVEEIARIRGYDSIPATLPRSAGELKAEPREAEVERRMRSALAGAGFDEAVNYSFVSPRELSALGDGVAPILLRNPLSAEQSAMRTSLIPSLLQNLSHNARQQVPSVRLYELGRIYLPDPEGGQNGRPVSRELLRLGGVLWGRRENRTWTAKDAAVDFFDAKGAVEAVLAALNLKGQVQFEPGESPRYHPRACARVRLPAGEIGWVGELHPRLIKALDVPAGAFVFELDAELLGKSAALVPTFQALSRFPAVLRDLAVVVESELPHEEVRRLLLEVGAPLVEDALVFDVYSGKPIPEGKKNLAYALRYRAEGRTLTDVEVNEAHQKIVAQLNQRLGGSLRGSNPQ